MNRRDIQLDVLKGLGIILVVFAHTAHNIASDFVYLFHMPLFFFLSGAALAFSKDMDYHFGKKIYRMVIPYVAFSLLSFFYWRLVESRFRPVHDGDLFPMLSGMLDMGWQQFLNIFLAFSFEDAFLYNVVLWFLPCLLMSTMIYGNQRYTSICRLVNHHHGFSHCHIYACGHDDAPVHSVAHWDEKD